MKHSHRCCSYTTLAVALAAMLTAPARSQPEAETPWWNTDWSERYRVDFERLGPECGAEMAVVTFRPSLARRGDPYDLRAIDDDGGTVAAKVLYWTPGGDMTCLLGVDPRQVSADYSLYLYLGNRDAPLQVDVYPWRDPMLLIGSGLKRRFSRHGEWVWSPDERFEAVHVGATADSGRVSHWVTGFQPVYCHQSRMRLTQMAWIDPATPPEAIAVDFVFDSRRISAYWSDDEPPEDTIGQRPVTHVGPMPETGRWVLLSVTGSQLGLSNSESSLRGIGFSNHGGVVRWGPTSFGAMPISGKATERQILIGGDAGAPRIETVLLDEVDAYAPVVENVFLSLVDSPLFVERGRPLAMTYFVHLSYRFTGRFPYCELEVAGEWPDGSRRVLRSEPVLFTGGDNWQGAVELSADEWDGASAIHARLLDKGRLVCDSRLRLEAPGYTPGLKANGVLLQVGDDGLAYVLGAPGQKRSADTAAGGGAPNDSARLVLSPSLFQGRAPDDGDVAVNSDDPRLGLDDRVSPYTRRSAAEWVVAASVAAGTKRFDAASVVVDSETLDVGLTLSTLGVFLRGVIALLQSDPDIRVDMDLSALAVGEQTGRRRAMLAVAMEAHSFLEGKKE